MAVDVDNKIKKNCQSGFFLEGIQNVWTNFRREMSYFIVIPTGSGPGIKMHNTL